MSRPEFPEVSYAVTVTSWPGRMCVVPERNSTFCVMKAESLLRTQIGDRRRPPESEAMAAAG